MREKNGNNIYKIIKKEKDQIVISNSIGGFLELTDIINAFVKCISQIDYDGFQLLREEFNVDLLFYYKKDDKTQDIIIIENKLVLD